MAIVVYTWVHSQPEQSFNEAVVPDRPAVNATSPVTFDPDASRLRQYIVDSWNRTVAPTPLAALADFEFVAPPAGWANPNDPSAGMTET